MNEYDKAVVELYEEWERTEPIIGRAAADLIAAKGCAVPGCTENHEDHPMFPHPRCHPGNPDIAYYHGCLFVSCHVCNAFVVRFLVGELQ